MSTASLTRRPSTSPAKGPEHHLVSRVLGAGLALGVAYIHVKDQGGFPGDKTPTYVGIGYYALEIAGLLAAVLLLVGAGRHTAKAWLLAVGVAVAPIVGFVLSRGPGLPDYTDDKGNWTETLGVVSLVVEGALLLLAVALVARSRRRTA
ncbi:MAG: hypothetical protein JWO12_3520 [Frankiales bacterium]|nr:hypothetical protein [Frankiales bacterium]